MNINPGTQVGRGEILDELAKEAGLELGLRLQHFDLVVAEDSGTPLTFMFIFDAHHQRIIRAEGGSHTYKDLDQVDEDWLIDTQKVKDVIKSAIQELAREAEEKKRELQPTKF